MKRLPLPALMLALLLFCWQAAAISKVSIKDKNQTLSYSFKYNSVPAFLRVYLDTDSIPSTGYPVGTVGANFLLENGKLYRYAGQRGSWKWTPVKDISFSRSNKTAKFKVTKADIGNPNSMKVVASCSLPHCTSRPVEQSTNRTKPKVR